MQFREIEHKYIIAGEAEARYLHDRLLHLGAQVGPVIESRDLYYRLKNRDDIVLRHRFDKFINQLTLKEIAKDAEDRLEINLDLVLQSATNNLNESDQEIGRAAAGKDHPVDAGVDRSSSQKGSVSAFVSQLGGKLIATIDKKLRVYDLDAFECVIYHAENKVSQQAATCFEIEVRDPGRLSLARASLIELAERLHLDPKSRTPLDLLQLLNPPK